MLDHGRWRLCLGTLCRYAMDEGILKRRCVQPQDCPVPVAMRLSLHLQERQISC
jgi:hypothetical protein